MALDGQDKPSTHDLLQGQLKLWHHSLGYIKSMALKSALDLRIPDAIHGSGGTATLSEILTKTALHPSKRPCLRRLMRVLTVSGIFSIHQPAAPTDGGEAVYGLTTASRLLVSGKSPTCLSPGMSMLLSTAFVTPFLRLGSWFQNEMPMISPFEMAHDQTFWEMAEKDAAFNELVNNGMVSDSRFCIDIVRPQGRGPDLPGDKLAGRRRRGTRRGGDTHCEGVPAHEVHCAGSPERCRRGSYQYRRAFCCRRHV